MYSVLRDLLSWTWTRTWTWTCACQLLTAICPEPVQTQSLLHQHLQIHLHLENPIVYSDYGRRLFRPAANLSRRNKQNPSLGELLRDQSHFAEASVAAAAAPSSSPAGCCHSLQRPSNPTSAISLITRPKARHNEVVFRNSVSGAVNMDGSRLGGPDG